MEQQTIDLSNITSNGGGSGIRTHGTLSRTHAFQACALSRSAIPPREGWKLAASLSAENPADKTVEAVAGEPDGPPADDQAFGGKKTRARASMLSRGGASAVASGFSNEVWNDSLARPSVALSCTRIRITSSGSCSEK